ncbi:MAG: ParB/RepB/Spo0J family partition protein [Clostridia bacterium]|nr:ParB/RepB/Spo0J family partition protein [Clostridia bacterium]
MAKVKKGGLGRDFNSLFEDNFIDTKKNAAEILRISDIEPNPDQPRKQFNEDELLSLSASIAEYGLLQPIVVTESKVLPGTYVIIAGERRWRASRMAGLDEIPCVIFDGDELAAAQVALVENIQRSDLNPIEEAMGYRALIDRFGMTQDSVAQKIGKSRPAVTNALRLLELPEEVLPYVADCKLSAGHARTLLGLNDKSAIPALAERVIAEALSVRELEAEVKKLNNPAAVKVKVKKPVDEQTAVYMEQLERRAVELSGRRVKIKDMGVGKRRIEIDFDDTDDLSELLLTLCGPEIFEL